jgi:hypothetical protein
LIFTNDILHKLKDLDSKYWVIFMRNYPTLVDESLPFNDNGLCDTAIEVRMLLTKLGETATKRMIYIGFDLVYPFDNLLDWYSWASKIRINKIPHEEYSTIAERISSEIAIMERYLNDNSWDDYKRLTEDIFSTGKHRSKYPKILALTES